MQIKHGLVFDLEKGFEDRDLRIRDGVITDDPVEDPEIIDAADVM